MRLVPALIKEGGYLWKIPVRQTRSAGAKRRWFRFGGTPRGDMYVTWSDPNGAGSDVRRFSLGSVVEVRSGHETPAWWAQATARKALPVKELCWSLVAFDGKTLDLAAETIPEARLWIDAFNAILAETSYPQQRKRRSRRRHDQGMAYHDPLSPPHFHPPERDHGREDHFAPVVSSPPKPTRRSDNMTKRGAVPTTPKTPPQTEKSSQRRLHAQMKAAVKEGRTEEVASLLSSELVGPDEVIDTDRGDTALLLACRVGSPKLVTTCLDHGSRNDPHPSWGCTALQIAVAGGHAAVVRALLEAAAASGADAAIANHVVLATDDVSPTCKGDSPLHVAAKRLDAPTVQLLLEHHADVLARDSEGRTPAHVAVMLCQDRGYEVLGCVLENGGEKDDEVLDARDDAGDTLLHVAATVGARRCAELLLKFAASVHLTNNAGDTPRKAAIRVKHFDLAGLILTYEADHREARQSHITEAANGPPLVSTVINVRPNDAPVTSSLVRNEPPPRPTTPHHSVAIVVAPPFNHDDSSVAAADDDDDESFSAGFYTRDGEHWVELYSDEHQYPYFLHVASAHTQWQDPRLDDDHNEEAVVHPVAAQHELWKDETPRRTLSGGPLVTAVDMFTAAGGRRSRSRSPTPLVVSDVASSVPSHEAAPSVTSGVTVSDDGEIENDLLNELIDEVGDDECDTDEDDALETVHCVDVDDDDVGGPPLSERTADVPGPSEPPPREESSSSRQRQVAPPAIPKKPSPFDAAAADVPTTTTTIEEIA